MTQKRGPLNERENKERSKKVDSDNSRVKKREDILNGVREWLQAQKERELKNESRVSLEEMKKSEASVIEEEQKKDDVTWKEIEELNEASTVGNTFLSEQITGNVEAPRDVIIDGIKRFPGCRLLYEVCFPYLCCGKDGLLATETIMFSDTWFDWVESSRYCIRRMTLNKGALGWLCRRMREAPEVRGKMFKTRRGRDVSTNIFCSLKFNKFGRSLSIIAVDGQMRSVIIVPENKDNEGWLGLEPTISKVQVTVTASSHHDGKDLLQRCLIGSFPDCNEMPTRNDVRSRGKMHNTFFLVTGRDRANNLCLTGGLRHLGLIQPTPLGLPLQLWSENIMKEIGDKCGGWLATEKKPRQKNHLRWAQIKVKGPIENIPREVEIQDGCLIFSLPVWVEDPARFCRSEVVELDSQEVSPRLEKERDKAANSMKKIFPGIRAKERGKQSCG
ncbi:hypothetical protein H5410_002268 [Solanum commersonii]|uniref:DUF4283 domain-containing protein n=1 Tax=Solanum commersonii TaxID=4109 RepID=A0A9J6B2F2_SOLCO|nr:hypothetical protein H5410_002268 [Solanum commersonii]